MGNLFGLRSSKRKSRKKSTALSSFDTSTRIGGAAPALESWPHFSGKPLPFFCQVKLGEDKVAWVFLDDSVDGSWAVEDSANAVIVSGESSPEWVAMQPLGERKAPVKVKEAIIPEKILEAPEWLQGDETPEGYHFVLQVSSHESGLNIGAGYGTVYIFISDDEKQGRVLWQS